MKKQRGLTLIEIMVVVAILGIIATVVIRYVGNSGQVAAQNLSRFAVSNTAEAVEQFRMDYGRLPCSLDELVFRPDDIDPAKWHPKRNEVPRDGWKRPLVYRAQGTDGFPFDVISLGADGREGGERFDEDLWNHARRP